MSTYDGNLIDPVVRGNLDRLSSELARDEELRLCELASVAESAVESYREYLADGLSAPEAIAALSLALSEELDPDAAFSLRTLSDRSALTSLLCELLAERDLPLRESDFLPSELHPPVIAYVKNALADEAFDVFSSELPDARVRYATTFSEAVERLTSGEVGYCLFPLEESGGVRLSTVERLVLLHDLHVCRVTPVFGPDGTAQLKYALISSSVEIAPYSKEDDRYLELRLSTESLPLCELSTLAQLLGFPIYRVNTLSFAKGDGEETYLSLVFKAQGEDFTPLLLYLALFGGEYTVVGLYQNLEN